MPTDQLTYAESSQQEEAAQNAPPADIPQVLVLADDTRVLLPIARSLGRRGIEVHVAWCPPRALGLRSRYIHTIHDIPRPDGASDNWWGELRDLIKQQNYSLVLPATETAAQAFHETRELWQDLSSVCLLNREAYETAANKEKTHELAKSLGVPVPATIPVSNRQQYFEAIQRLNGAAIIKPLSSRTSDSQFEKNYVRRIESIQEGQQYAELMNGSPWNVLVQEVFTGTGIGVEVLADQGRLLVAFQHRRLHETTGHGSMYRESGPVDPQLLEAVKILARATKFTGIGMFEFRMDPQTGKFVLLEINGRFWGSLGLALASGVDFPFYLYQLHVENRQEFPQDFRQGIRSRDLSGDLRWMKRSLKKKRPALTQLHQEEYGWDVNHLPRLKVAIDLARILLPRDRIDSFAWDDPWPAVVEFLRLGRSSVLKFLPGKHRQATA